MAQITRREINRLSVAELNALREAFHRLQMNPGADGFPAILGLENQQS